MKNKLVIYLLFLVFIANGCTPKQNNEKLNQHSGILEKVKKTKELHVGYFIFEPTIMEDKETNKLYGLFIDIIEIIGESLNAEVIYHKVDLANFVSGLHSRQYDLCIGATFATPKRATSVLFTDPIFYSGYTGVIADEKYSEINSWEEIDQPNIKVAVKQGSAIDDFVRAYFNNAEIMRLTGSDLTIPLAAVSSGQADIGLMNQITVYTYLREHPELQEILSANPIAPTNFSWTVRSDDIRWLHFINTCIEYLHNTGEIYRLEEKYNIPLLHEKTEYFYPLSK